MLSRRLAAVAAAALVIAVPAAAAAEQGEMERLLSSKLRLLDALVNDSPNSIRIRESNDDAAKKQFSAAVAAYEEARQMMVEGQLEGAERALDAGLAAASDASRRVADRQRELQLQKKRYDDLTKRVLSYREAFERVAREKGGGETDALLDQGRVKEAIEQAQTHAQRGDFGKANARLLYTSELLERALSSARHQETLLHELKFDTPTEEYEYERQRNRSYEMLIGILLKEKNASATVQGMIEKWTKGNDELLGQAEMLAAAGETEEAIVRLEEATANLIRALRVSGVALP